MTYFTAGQRLTGELLENFIQRGEVLVSFTSQTSHTQDVVFPVPFAAAPIMAVNIASGAGATARWGARAIGVTATQFTLFLFVGDAGASAATWSGIEVQWIAVAA